MSENLDYESKYIELKIIGKGAFGFNYSNK